MDTIPSTNRFVLTQVGACRLVIPFEWVAEIMILDRAAVLPLPFYATAIMGVIYHNGQVIPLVAMDQILGETSRGATSTLTAVRLDSKLKALANVGLVVDKALGSRRADQLPSSFLGSEPIEPTGLTPDPSTFRLFNFDLIDPILWNPVVK